VLFYLICYILAPGSCRGQKYRPILEIGPTSSSCTKIHCDISPNFPLIFTEVKQFEIWPKLLTPVPFQSPCTVLKRNNIIEMQNIFYSADDSPTSSTNTVWFVSLDCEKNPRRAGRPSPIPLKNRPSQIDDRYCNNSIEWTTTKRITVIVFVICLSVCLSSICTGPYRSCCPI